MMEVYIFCFCTTSGTQCTHRVDGEDQGGCRGRLLFSGGLSRRSLVLPLIASQYLWQAVGWIDDETFPSSAPLQPFPSWPLRLHGEAGAVFELCFSWRSSAFAMGS